MRLFPNCYESSCFVARYLDTKFIDNDGCVTSRDKGQTPFLFTIFFSAAFFENNFMK